MAPLTWTPDGSGTVAAGPDDLGEGATILAAGGDGLDTFLGAPVVDGTGIDLAVRGTDYFAIYVDTATDRGRREFKFVPEDGDSSFDFGYRYTVRLGTDHRDGSTRELVAGLDDVAVEFERGVEIDRITSVSMRAAGTLEAAVRIGRHPITPPPTEPPSSDAPSTDAEAARFLAQATFGATPATIAELRDLGSYEAWIDRQLALPQSLTRPYAAQNSGSNRRPRHQIFWQNVVYEPDQLRQRLALAWSELFVISDIDYELRLAQRAITGYYDMLGELSTGDFRTMLERVTLSPVMGIYLSMLRNEKADPVRNVRPDENFAREILQLFTIGLNELESDGTVKQRSGATIPAYDQQTVEAFARVFTGWNLKDAPWTSGDLTKYDKESPMQPVAQFHDTTAKKVLGGSTIAAGGDAATDLSRALDVIVAHPNVGPFVARHLIQRFVTSNPTPAYIGRVAGVFVDNGSGERGDLEAVTRAVLLDAEARNGPASLPATFGKVKEPMMRLSHLWRAFDVTDGPSSGGNLKTPAKVVDQLDDVLGQAVLRSPSVFNFFLPDHPLEADGGLVAPELEIHTEINVASTNNMLFHAIYDSNNFTKSSTNATSSRIVVDREVELATDPAALVDHVDLVLLSGSMPDDVRTALIAHLESLPDTDDGRLQRALDAIYCTIASPAHLVQK